MIYNDPIIQEIDRFILRFGGIYSNFFVGITHNPMRRIHDEHEIGQANPYFLKEAENTETARIIERYFIDLGCDGCGSGGDEDSVYVYAYKKGPRTKP